MSRRGGKRSDLRLLAPEFDFVCLFLGHDTSVLSQKFAAEFKGGTMARAKARWACQNEAVVFLGIRGNLSRLLLNGILFCSSVGLCLRGSVSLRNTGEPDLFGFVPADFGGAHQSSARAIRKL
ncbi:MAG: hypothetical protein AMJ94_03280 [Deltaproteobacteria bacterium SM23_61]|nr:MAG: hypothetical protein AMJ94_03280 [Deltaproteobacteria bacterium SM23_61]